MIERRTTRRVDASPADVGRRISLRYKQDPLGMTHGEAVGVLHRWTGTGDEGILMLRRRDDTTIRIPFRDVEVARIVPPELSALRMQEYAEATWPAGENEDIGCWRLRRTNGVTSRANSVRVAGPADRPLTAALDYAREWYEARGGRPLLQLPDPSPLDGAYDEHGWPVLRRSRFMTNSTQRLLTSMGPVDRSDMLLTISEEPDEAWLDLLVDDDERTRQEMITVLRPGLPSAYVSCRHADTGELIGIGRATVVGDWVGASAMKTATSSLRRGVGTAVMGKLAEWARERRLNQWFLQVFADSEPALALYDGLGFTAHHDYVYRGPAGQEVA